MCFVGCSASSPGILKLFMVNGIVKRQRNREDVNPSTRTHQVVAVPVFGRFVSYIVYCWIYSCLISGKHYHDFPNHEHQSTTWPFVSHPPFLPPYSVVIYKSVLRPAIPCVVSNLNFLLVISNVSIAHPNICWSVLIASYCGRVDSSEETEIASLSSHGVCVI